VKRAQPSQPLAMGLHGGCRPRATARLWKADVVHFKSASALELASRTGLTVGALGSLQYEKAGSARRRHCPFSVPALTLHRASIHYALLV
jgi:hypothetical protein